MTPGSCERSIEAEAALAEMRRERDAMEALAGSNQADAEEAQAREQEARGLLEHIDKELPIHIYNASPKLYDRIRSFLAPQPAVEGPSESDYDAGEVRDSGYYERMVPSPVHATAAEPPRCPTCCKPYPRLSTCPCRDGKPELCSTPSCACVCHP